MANKTGAYVIDDSIPFDLTKDWAWNRKKLKALLLRDGRSEAEADAFLDKCEKKHPEVLKAKG